MGQRKSVMAVVLLVFFIWTKLLLQLRVVSMQVTHQEVMAVKLPSNTKVSIIGLMNLHLTNKFWIKVGEFERTLNPTIPKDWVRANTSIITTIIQDMVAEVIHRADTEITAQLRECAKTAIAQSIKSNRRFMQVNKFNKSYNNALIIK